MIICGDSLQILPAMKAESVDLVFADPPFNCGINYGIDKDKRLNYYEWCKKWIDECFRILKSTGTFYLMTLPRHLEKLFPMLGTRGVFISLIIWKNCSGSFHIIRKYYPSYQPILVYGKSQDYIFNRDVEIQKGNPALLRWGGYKTKARFQVKDIWDDISFVYAGSIYHPEAIIRPNTNKKIHPCQMPLQLASRAIKFSTEPGSRVLDPFAGIGTVELAALIFNRKPISIEINPDYCHLAWQRCYAQGNLFY